MKKFLKVFIVVLLVLAVVGVTCYFFFKKLKEKDNTTPSFASFLVSEEATEFNTNLGVIVGDLEKESDTRFKLLQTTNMNLNEIVFVLSTYNISNNTQINDKEISSAFKNVNASKRLILKMMKEYNLKKTSTYFDRKVGVNDLYEEMCAYLVKYANLANLLNDFISDVNKNSDVKFGVFEIYANVVKHDFSNISETGSLVEIKESKNIEKLNEIVTISELGLLLNNRFSENINKFNTNYSNCNKAVFVANFASNLDGVSSANQATKEKVAMYYFKLAFGLIK